jgi:hypothetical protein
MVGILGATWVAEDVTRRWNRYRGNARWCEAGQAAAPFHTLPRGLAGPRQLSTGVSHSTGRPGGLLPGTPRRRIRTFEQKMVQVLCVYREVAILGAARSAAAR